MKMFYQLTGQLKRIKEPLPAEHSFFAAILRPKDWEQIKTTLGFPEYAIPESGNIRACRTEIYSGYMTAVLLFYDKEHLFNEPQKISLFINRTCMAIVDEGSLADRILCKIVQKYGQQEICPELFLYGFLYCFIQGDLELLENYEKKLMLMEERALHGKIHDLLPSLLLCRRALSRLRCSCEQLEDLARELEENEKDYFDDEKLNYIRLFGDRAGRLHDGAQQMIEYCQTIREVCQDEIEHRQNRHMQFLTVITAIFFPLTLIAGWYGMNFTYMPEIHSQFGYPAVIIVSLGVIIGEFIFFKKKKLL